MATLQDKLLGKVAAGRSATQKRESMELDDIGLDKLASALDGIAGSDIDIDEDVTAALAKSIEGVQLPTKKDAA